MLTWLMRVALITRTLVNGRLPSACGPPPPARPASHGCGTRSRRRCTCPTARWCEPNPSGGAADQAAAHAAVLMRRLWIAVATAAALVACAAAFGDPPSPDNPAGRSNEILGVVPVQSEAG